MKTIRLGDGRTIMIVGNRKKLSTEQEILQRVADEAGVPVDAPAYPRPLGAARGEQLAEAEKTRLISEALRRAAPAAISRVWSRGRKAGNLRREKPGTGERTPRRRRRGRGMQGGEEPPLP